MHLFMILILAGWLGSTTCSPIALDSAGDASTGAGEVMAAQADENAARGLSVVVLSSTGQKDRVNEDLAQDQSDVSVQSRLGLSLPTQTRPSGGRGCTTTIVPSSVFPCAWDGTETVYPSTKTAFAQVDCRGCVDVFVQRYTYFCPDMRIHGIKTTNQPSTLWSTICSPQPTSGIRPAEAAEPTATEGLKVRQACQTTHVVQPQRTAGPTATQYQRIVTETVKIPCRGCQLRLSTALGGYGPINRFSKTVTVPVGTTTIYQCQ